jgi:hypothetical protein
MLHTTTREGRDVGLRFSRRSSSISTLQLSPPSCRHLYKSAPPPSDFNDGFEREAGVNAEVLNALRKKLREMPCVFGHFDGGPI